ncbi:Something about silencing protein 10 [Trichuris trichiura]|uniref:Something about silencing protein 10 n=1 Tax=Trichuris trichiura TaxID=36087 RepID=A0A077ZBK7_TRITR|nr:Something about silencing protein 10 [Trichuris trichiura]
MSGEEDPNPAPLEAKYLMVATPSGLRTVSRDSLVTESTLFSASSFVSADLNPDADNGSPLSGGEVILKNLVELSVTLRHDLEALYPDGFLFQSDFYQRRGSPCFLLRSPSLTSLRNLKRCIGEGIQAPLCNYQKPRRVVHSISADSLPLLFRKEQTTWQKMLAMSNLVVAQIDYNRRSSPQASMLCIGQPSGHPVGVKEKRDSILRWLRSVKENASDNYQSIKNE